MQLNEFEKYIASNIDGYQSKIDTDSLWDTLETDLDQKKRKRRLVFLVIGLLTISALSFIGVSSYLVTSGEDVDSSSSQVEQPISTQQEFANAKSKSKKIEASNLSVSGNSDISTSIKDSPVRTNNKSNQSKTITGATPATDNDVSSSQTREVSSNLQVLFPAFTNQNSFSASQLDGQTAINMTQQITEQALMPNAIHINTQAANLKSLDYLDFIPNNLLEWEKTKVKLKKRPGSTLDKKWRMSIAPQFGIYYTDRTIGTNNSMGENLKDYRNDSEQTLETLSLGVGAELQHQSNFYISAGVRLNQLTEKFNSQTSEFSIENIEYIQEINYLANGSVHEVSGTFNQGQETITTSTTYNTLRWAELTLGGGYRYDLKRWQFGAGAGLMWGTMLNVEGRIFDANRNIIDIENQPSSIYRNNLGLGGYGHIDLQYALDNRLSLSTQIGYKFYGNSFTESTYPLDITYQWWGGTVGLSYRLF